MGTCTQPLCNKLLLGQGGGVTVEGRPLPSVGCLSKLVVSSSELGLADIQVGSAELLVAASHLLHL